MHRDPKNLDIAESLLATDAQSISQELYGISMSSESHLFRELLPEFRQRHEREGAYRFSTPVGVLHTYIDPSGGSSASDYAMVTVARVKDQYIIVAMSAWVNDRTANSHIAINKMYKDHYDSIFSRPAYRNAKVWAYFELQSSCIPADQYSDFCNRLYPGKFVMFRGMQGDPNQIGVPVTDDIKMSWTEALMEVMVGQSLWFAADMCTSAVGDLSEEDAADLMKAKLLEQMSRYAVEVRAPPDPFGKVKVFFGAKAGGKCDDVVTCLAGVILQMKKRLISKEYRQWCIAHNVQYI